MRRLVYSPKVYAFVRTDAHPEGINITDFIVRGNVHRRINAVSTAEIELRNPDKMFTLPGSPVFHPMDPITIFLTRLADRPVQVFTGYLDTSPYLQLFPGTVKLTASCTLKRLLHTYWDPALPYVWDNFLREYGWNLDPKTGEIFSPAARTENLDDTHALNDGSYGNLLFGLLKDVGGWTSDSIYIEKLPDGSNGTVDIVEKVTDIYSSIAKESDGISDNIQTLFRSMLGSTAIGQGGGLLGDDATDSDTTRGDEIGTATTTAYGPPWNTMNGSGVTAGGTDLKDGKRRYIVAADNSVFPIGTRLYIDPNPYNYRGTFLVDDTGGWFKQGGPRAGGIDFYIAEGRDKQLSWGTRDVKVYKAEKKTDDEKSHKGAAPDDGVKADPKGTNRKKRVSPIKEDVGTPSYNYGQDRGNHAHAGIDWAVPVGTPIYAAHDGRAVRKSNPGGYGTYLDLVGNGVVTRYGHLSAYKAPDGETVTAGTLIALSGNSGHSTGPHLHFEVRNGETFGITGTIDPKGWLAGAADPTGSPTDGAKSGDSGGGTAAGGSTSAAVFNGYLNLPGALDWAEAIGLSGQKSMLNDQPLFPFVQQVCQGSLRNFQSMPNGNFYGFFPDYFGGFGHRTPYWLIDDIEVLDGGIDLTDDFLATHVYIVGDTNFDGQINFMDRLQSGGVMDLESALKSGFVVADPMTHGDVLNFLKKYGARPYKEELPMIRSPFFEAFLAYQRFMQLWAKQFATTFQFTFMPELFPGGIVGLMDHGIQCYLEEVIHVFDYETGFTTEAVLSSPATMKNSPISAVSAGMVRGFDVTPDPAKPTAQSTPNQRPSDRGGPGARGAVSGL